VDPLAHRRQPVSPDEQVARPTGAALGDCDEAPRETVEERYQTAAGVEAALRSASRHASRWADRPVPAPHTERASDRLMMVQEIVLAPLGSTMSSASSPTLCIACRSARCPGTTGALEGRRQSVICDRVLTRAWQIDGKLDIHTTAGHGTSIVLTVPIPL
jgi:hypothetical protein